MHSELEWRRRFEEHQNGLARLEQLPGCAVQVDMARWAVEDVGVLRANFGGARPFATSTVKEFPEHVVLSPNVSGRWVVVQRGEDASRGRPSSF